MRFLGFGNRLEPILGGDDVVIFVVQLGFQQLDIGRDVIEQPEFVQSWELAPGDRDRDSGFRENKSGAFPESRILNPESFSTLIILLLLAEETAHGIEERHDGDGLRNIGFAAGRQYFFLVVLHGEGGDGDDGDAADGIVGF